MKKLLCTCASLLLLTGPARADSEPFVGEIITFYFSFCPRGYLPTDGRLMPISQNTALFSLLTTTYGGNGQTNFALPLMNPQFTSGQIGVEATSCIAVQGVFPPRP
jgi:microcystin-dependent protein